MAGGIFDTPSGNREVAANQFNNLNLNAFGSEYADQFLHDENTHIQRILRKVIFDEAPQQFFDLKILMAGSIGKINSDETFWESMPFGREAVVVAAGAGLPFAAAGATSVSSIPVTPASIDAVSIDTIIKLDDNTQAIVTAVDSGANTIDIAAMTGQTLPAINEDEVYANHSPVEADGVNSISQYYRLETLTRYNFVQIFAAATRFGRVEYEKYKRAGTTDYLVKNKQRMIDQFRVSISNSIWNGERGEIPTSQGLAKTMGGIFPTMVADGAANTTATSATIADAVEDMALATEFGGYGDTKYLFGTPRNLLRLKKALKVGTGNATGEFDRLRFSSTEREASYELDTFDIGSTKIALVPCKRFEEPSCFPSAFANRLFLLNMENINLKEFLPMRMGELGSRNNNVNAQTYMDYFVDWTMTMEFDNPADAAYIDVTP